MESAARQIKANDSVNSTSKKHTEACRSIPDGLIYYGRLKRDDVTKVMMSQTKVMVSQTKVMVLLTNLKVEVAPLIHF